MTLQISPPDWCVAGSRPRLCLDTIASPLNAKFDGRGLRNNGGPTLTVALTATSPGVDQGTSLGLTGILSTDQRGAGFLRKVDKAAANATGGDGTDIGAYELQ